MTARILSRSESILLDEDIAHGIVRDERRATRRVEYFIPGTVLRPMRGPEVAAFVALMQEIARMPGIELTAGDRDDAAHAPGWIRIVALPRPVPRITDAPLPGYRPGPTYFDVREYEDAAHRVAAEHLYGVAWPLRGGKSTLFGSGISSV